MVAKSTLIALEEHHYDPEVKRHFRGLDAITAAHTVERLDDLGALRLREMDEAGIDMQVLSHSMPGLQKLEAETAVPLARRVNDRLNEAVRAHPGRFAGFTALPTADPKAAADELERTVSIPRYPTPPSSRPTTGIMQKSILEYRAPAGCSPWRPRRRAFAQY
jgi:predicted TIM-barrel fold metal-dependent hydrolase